MVSLPPAKSLPFPRVSGVGNPIAPGSDWVAAGSASWCRLFDCQNLLGECSSQLADLLTRLRQVKTDLETLRHQKPRCVLPFCLPDTDQCRSRSPESLYRQVRLVHRMPSPVCKGKYFQLEVKAMRMADSPLPEGWTVPLRLAVLSSEREPTIIRENMAGEPICRGSDSAMLKYDPWKKAHTACFRVQITEVTSHFVNGHITLVISAPDSDDSKDLLVQPLVIPNVVSLAKERLCRRIREREGTATECSEWKDSQS